MENTYHSEYRYLKAKKQVEEIKGFYGNVTAYVIFNLVLLTINLVSTPNRLWFFWPMFGWGIGVVIHGMRVFNYMPLFGQKWEEKKIKEFIEKENQQKNKKSSNVQF